MMTHDNPWTLFVIMMISGMLTTMNLWVDKWSDIRWSLNDVYMSLVMTGWMFLLMGHLWVGLVLVGFGFIAIRRQWGISESQYKLGMIPHHSMAVLMSKKLFQRTQSPFAAKIIQTQTQEIEELKQ